MPNAWNIFLPKCLLHGWPLFRGFGALCYRNWATEIRQKLKMPINQNQIDQMRPWRDLTNLCRFSGLLNLQLHFQMRHDVRHVQSQRLPWESDQCRPFPWNFQTDIWSTASLLVHRPGDLRQSQHGFGHHLNSYSVSTFCTKNHWICLESKLITPCQGNTILFRSSQQLPVSVLDLWRAF